MFIQRENLANLCEKYEKYYSSGWKYSQFVQIKYCEKRSRMLIYDSEVRFKYKFAEVSSRFTSKFEIIMTLWISCWSKLQPTHLFNVKTFKVKRDWVCGDGGGCFNVIFVLEKQLVTLKSWWKSFEILISFDKYFLKIHENKIQGQISVHLSVLN